MISQNQMELEPILEWQSPEHPFERKSKDWYWGLGIISLGITVLAFYFSSYLFGIFIVIAAITLGFLSYKDTRAVTIRVAHQGIILGKRLYPFKIYRSFWIDDEHMHGVRILLHPTSPYMPLMIVPVSDEIDLNDLQEVLLEFLEEEYMQESIIHKWLDKALG